MKYSAAKKNEAILVAVLKLGILFLILTPLIAWDQVVFPLLFPKIIYFRTIVGLLFFIFLILIIKHPSYRPKRHFLLTLLILSLSIASISSLFGINIYRSFFSTLSRGDGIITLIHLLIFLLIFISVFQKKEHLTSVLLTMFLVIFTENIIALGQAANISFIKNAGMDRPTGTLGNPAFFASFIVLGVWITVLLLAHLRRYRFSKILLFLSFLNIILTITNLILTKNRGGMLALVGSAIIFWIAVSALPLKKKIMTAALSALTLIFLLVLSLSREVPFISKPLHLSWDDITTQNRLIAWKIGIRGFLERPILGWGNENYYAVFNKYYDPSIIRDPGSYPWYDRSHNMFIDVLVANGILGISSYLLIFAVALFLLQKENSLSSLQKAALTAFITAFLIQNFFLFDTINTSLLLFFIFGWIIVSTPKIQKFSFLKKYLRLTTRRLTIIPHAPFHHTLLFLIIGAVLFSSIFIINISPLAASYYASQVFLDPQRTPEQILNDYQKAFRFSPPHNQELRQGLGNYLNQQFKSPHPETKKLLPLALFAIQHLQKSALADPYNVQTRLILAELSRLVSPLDSRFLTLAEYHARQALELSPKRYQTYFALGRIKFSQKQYHEGIAFFREVLKFNPDFYGAHWNLAIGYILQGNIDLAKKKITLLAQKDAEYFYDPANLPRLVGALLEKKQYFLAEELFRNASNYHQKQSDIFLRNSQSTKDPALAKSYLEKSQDYAKKSEEYQKRIRELKSFE